MKKEEEFFKGTSSPINKKLFDIFKTCGFSEESGHGVPAVVKAYGEGAYKLSTNFIYVSIPFDRTGFSNVITQKNIQETSKKHPRKNH